MHNPAPTTATVAGRDDRAPRAAERARPASAVRAAVHPPRRARDHDGHRRARPAARRHLRA